ncbi:MAG: hypothetical protein LBN24_04895, partial [Mediterranea sp.]|nr:hypothetical protein [Mediterranea sp.]
HKDDYNAATAQAYADIDGDDSENPGEALESPFIDVADYVQVLTEKSNNPNIVKLGAEFKKAVDEALIYRESASIVDDLLMSWGVSLTNGWLWSELGYGNGAYEATAFDKATGWSRWLQLNEELPTMFLPNPSGDENDDVDKRPIYGRRTAYHGFL